MKRRRDQGPLRGRRSAGTPARTRRLAPSREAPPDVVPQAPAAAPPPSAVAETAAPPPAAPQQPPRRRRITRVLLGVLAALLALLLLAGAWFAAFLTGIQNDLVSSPEHEAASKALTPEEDVSEPFTVLLMGDDRRKGETKSRADTIIVARVDPEENTVRMVSIPRDSRVEIPGHGTDKINAATYYGGPALMVDTLEEYLGVPINHYMQVDFNGFQEVVDAMGGVWIDVDVEIDDRKAASHGKRRAQHIDPGYQLLDGEHALTYVRSRKFEDGDFTRMRHQQTFFKALAKQSLKLGSAVKLPSVMEAMAKHTTTDMEIREILTLVQAMRGIGEDSVQTETLTGPTATIGGVSYVIPDEAEKARLAGLLDPGSGDEGGIEQTLGEIEPSLVSVTVWNGSGEPGSAGAVADELRSAGFDVEGVNNAERFGYRGTLVLYSGREDQANAVASALGLGTVEPSSSGYSFESDVLVIVGEDWETRAP